MPRASEPQAKVRWAKAISRFATVKQEGPKLRHLFALGDGIGCHKADLRLALLDVFACFDKPRGHIVEGAAASSQCSDVAHLFALPCSD